MDAGDSTEHHIGWVSFIVRVFFDTSVFLFEVYTGDKSELWTFYICSGKKSFELFYLVIQNIKLIILVLNGIFHGNILLEK